MSKLISLSDDAIEALEAARKSPKEHLSKVVLRFVPRPIRTFGDLEKHLDSLDSQALARIDLKKLRALRVRKLKGHRAD